jgi:hypothetical protein
MMGWEGLELQKEGWFLDRHLLLRDILLIDAIIKL